jgi:hypothetical protein
MPRHKASIPVPADGRQGWFEGVREGQLCGWTYVPDDPYRVLQVTLSSASGARTVLADGYRADLGALGLTEHCHGFSLPIEALPGAEFSAECTWTDLGLSLPGSPWAPRVGLKMRLRKGPMRLSLDSPAAGDPRLTGSAYDARDPLRRITIGAKWAETGSSTTVASLYRLPEWGVADDGFHGFLLALPAPLRMMPRGIAIFDADVRRILARLGPASLR